MAPQVFITTFLITTNSLLLRPRGFWRGRATVSERMAEALFDAPGSWLFIVALLCLSPSGSAANTRPCTAHFVERRRTSGQLLLLLVTLYCGLPYRVVVE